MSLGDITRRVITVYTADASGHRQELVKLEVEVDKLKSKEEEAGKSRVSSASAGIDALGKLGLAYAALEKAGSIAMDSVREASERARLENAAGAIQIDKLSAAAGGLQTQMELLSFAAKTQHASFALNQDQMVTVQKAMRELTREGFDQQEVFDKVTDAVVGLRTKGLKAFGIQVDETHSNTEKFTEIMEKLAGKAGLVGDGTQTAAEGMQAFGVSTADSFAKIKDAIGKLVVEFKPLIDALGDVASGISKIVEQAREYAKKNPIGFTMAATGVVGGQQVGEFIDKAGKAGMITPKNLARGMTMGATAPGGGAFGGGVDPFGGAFDGDVKGFMSGDYDIGGRAPNGTQQLDLSGGTSALDFGDQKHHAPAGTGLHERDWLTADIEKLDLAIRVHISEATADYAAFIAHTKLEKDRAHEAFFGQSLSQQQEPDWLRDNPQLGAGQKIDWDHVLDEHDQPGKDAAAKSARQQTFLESSFGKLEDFNAYKAAFDSLSGASTKAMKAWIDGSESAGKAFKHFIADALEGLASQMLIESLKHGAYALGSLAFGDASGAAGHAAAAAAFAAGAAAAAVAAKALGTTKGDAHAGSGGGGTSSGGSSNGGTGSNASGRDPLPTHSSVIVIGDSFADDSPRMRQIKAEQLVARALGSGGGVRNG